MKQLFIFLITINAASLFGQSKQLQTAEISIVGEVEKEVTVTIAELKKLKPQKLDDIIITNHLGEKKSTISGLSGVLLKDVLKPVTFKSDSPKRLSEFYFVFIASDGYKVVYSWNEIYNTNTGDNIFVIVEMDGKQLSEMDDRIAVICKSDMKTGRRFVKGLTQIVVKRVP